MFYESLQAYKTSSTPDLLIAGDSDIKVVSRMLEGVAKLIISEGALPPRSPRDVYFLKWPAEAEVLLDTTSRLLFISQRRIFSTPISVKVLGEDRLSMGRSVDFSASGLAFRCSRPLAKGQRVEISFFVPHSEKEVVFMADIMRTSVDPKDGATICGAMIKEFKGGLSDHYHAFIEDMR